MGVYIKRHFAYLLWTALAAALGSAAAVQSSLFMGKTLDAAIAFNGGYLLKSSAMTILFLCAETVLYMAYTHCRLQFQRKVATDLREDLLREMFLNSTAVYHQNDRDDHLNRLDKDVDVFQKDFICNIPLIIGGVLRLCIAAVALFSVHHLIFLAGTGLMVLPMLLSRLFIQPLQKVAEHRSEAHARYLTGLQELLDGYDLIKRTNRWERFLTSFHDKHEHNMATVARFSLWSVWSRQSLFTINSLGQLLMIAFGGYLIIRGVLTAGLLIAATSIIADFSDAVSNTMEYYVVARSTKVLIQKFEPALNRLRAGRSDEVLDKVLEKGVGTQVKCSAPSVEIQNLNFAFGKTQIFDQLNLSMASGGCYALLGASGSGKSTLANLLMKVYQDYCGNIRLDRCELRQISERTLFSSVTLIPQDPFIFKDTLFNNIMMYADVGPDTTLDYRTLLRTCVLEALESQYGETAVLNPDDLSRGEKQRVAVARALAQNPGLIIFDEPAASLDPEQVRNLNDIIFSLKHVTRLVITHDWSASYLSNFDAVFYLDTGAVSNQNPL